MSTPSDFYFNLTTGSVRELEDFHKFGRNLTVGTALEPITTAGVYRTPTTLTSLEILSSSANDGAGTNAGATKVIIVGIGPDWAEVTEEVELNGTTPVALVNQYFRIYRLFISETNVYGTVDAASHIGDLTLRETGGGDTWADLDNVAIHGRGQSQIACFSVPKGKRAYVRSTYMYVDTNKVCNIVFYQRDKADDVVAPYTGIMKVHIEFDGVSGQAIYNSPIPMGPFNECTDLIFMGSVASGTASVSVHFDIILVDQTNQS